MTKYFSGIKLDIQSQDLPVEPDYQCSTETLELAKKNLKEHFTLVGVLERFDEGLILLKRTLGWNIPLYTKNNVTKNRPSKSDISTKALSLLEKFNEYDIQLYEYGKGLFEELINQQDSSFAREVEKFKAANISSKAKPYFRIRTSYNRAINRVYKELIGY
jgi:hypothetical protein